MRKLSIGILMTMMLLIFIPMQMKAGNETSQASAASAKNASAKEASVLLTRLGTINAMDKAKMSFSEKRELRKEVSSIKSQLKELDGGIYLSVGAIIIILLLILLL